MNRSDRRARDYRPSNESLETRTVMSLTPPYVEFLHNVLFKSLGSQAERPNTPVAPFAATSKATFFDPTDSITAGSRIVLGSGDYVAPFVSLDGRGGFIEVGSNTTIQDNATLVANPSRIRGGPGIILGDNVFIGAGASVYGPGQIGAPGGAAVSIGANAVIDHASVQAGAEVGAMARVGPGVAILTGFRVLPGAQVVTEAEATNPALGRVVRLTGTDTVLAQQLTDNATLAIGYSALYQGNGATGPNISATSPTISNGSLAPVEGASQNPGSGTVSFETSAAPRFLSPFDPSTKLRVFTSHSYPIRAIGAVTIIGTDPYTAARVVGRHTSIRADEDQPITIGSVGRIGSGVTIHGYRGGKITAGTNLFVANGSVLTADSTGNLTLGDNVIVGINSVISGSKIGSNTAIGAYCTIINSTVPAGATIVSGTVIVNNRVLTGLS